MGLQWEKKIIQEYHGEVSFEDLVGRNGWINYFKYAFDPEEKGLLFIGEPHLGKKTLIRAAARDWEQKGYKAYEVYGEDFARDRKELREQIENIYAKIIGGKKILLLYSMDQIKKKEARAMLAFGLEQIVKDAENIIILATAQRAEKLPERLQKFFTICPVGKFREEELTEVMEAFLAPCCPKEKEKQEKIKKYLKDRNCWELKRIANLAVNYAVLELTDEEGKTLEEAQELLGEGKVQITTVQIQKAAKDVENVRWKKEPKEHIYADRVIERPSVQEQHLERQDFSQSKISERKEVIGIEKLGTASTEDAFNVASRILQNRKSTDDEEIKAQLREKLRKEGKLKKKIDISNVEVVD